MLRYTALLLVALAVVLLPAGSFAFREESRTEGMPWPLPQYMKLGEKIRLDQRKFTFKADFYCDILENAIIYYQELLRQTPLRLTDNSLDAYLRKGDGSAVEQLKITMGSPCPMENPPWNMVENYSLSIDPEGNATLNANEVWGALRGLETFFQLITICLNKTECHENSMVIWTGQIRDWPRFAYRGVLLDTSRHFLPVSLIKKNLEIMAQNKMNVFHWHIVDDHSFPLEIHSLPELSERGAYSEYHVYSQEDVTNIVKYARLWGVRVVVEIDTPSHVVSWGYGMPAFLSNCSKSIMKSTGILDPTAASTYDTLAAVFKEVFQLFSDKQVHLGGDEVNYKCWFNDTTLITFMKQMGFEKMNQVNNYYFNQLLKVLKNLDGERQYIFWNEVYDSEVTLPENAVIQVWTSNYKEQLAKITQGRNRVILSSCWYLNYVKYGNDWEEYYACDPHDFVGTAEQKELVIGGTACMWGEWIDGTNLIATLWPRASTVAERLWSSGTVNSSAMALPRLNEHRCRMLSRNYQVEPINGPGFCRETPGF